MPAAADVGNGLTSVPEVARPEVDRELALLDEQIAARRAPTCGPRPAEARW
ncbi:hypothetical protein [Streptomyces soliscabiei]|uniref:hypothetical protein n=1 Tax=Streptomyces soliscabiei TaxID=588897 RepID=UPI0029A489CC|nr:hypothetical protein [Streptomyces sp. NY05-11A]MDX2678326.1 hypothetical protein [Streptomyces sp. NY05-11A]